MTAMQKKQDRLCNMHSLFFIDRRAIIPFDKTLLIADSVFRNISLFLDLLNHLFISNRKTSEKILFFYYLCKLKSMA